MSIIDNLRERFEAPLAGTLTVEDITLQLREPTHHEARLVYAETWAAGQPLVAQTRANRALSERAVRGWSGVCVTHVVPGEAPAPLPCEAGAAALLFDARPDIERAVCEWVLARLAAREERFEAAAKN